MLKHQAQTKSTLLAIIESLHVIHILYIQCYIGYQQVEAMAWLNGLHALEWWGIGREIFGNCLLNVVLSSDVDNQKL